ncbi:hypothetical protein JCGZ_06764 [Jatropha curcas]|uniref:Uncharacterized protein n=1 Tax=Jatropha curcas TaxID=180498 RepID=A0A067KYH5_JATCU|nr:uncharacterized protein LOC110009523 [Jatropha curcas]KDP37310.1 hypothetical protein JCGZ_06764 [Jatropha curcas]
METDGASETSIVPAADANKDLQPAKNVDSVSSNNTVSSREVKEEEVTADKKEERKIRDPMQRLKTTILVSAVIIAVAGAAFAITRKLRQQ